MEIDWLFLGFIVAVAFCWAKLEIQIEGKDGWAKNLPTWRIEKHPWLDFVYGGAEITGYHIWAFTSLFLFFHLPFVWTRTWSFAAELHVVGGYTLFWIIEDWLWFVLNPAYGWRNLTREKVWWHKRWLWGLPTNYWISGAIGGLLFLLP
jgi:hypothetical protein